MREDAIIRVPKELLHRFNRLARRNSWNNFSSFSREAIRFFLDYQEGLERRDKRASVVET